MHKSEIVIDYQYGGFNPVQFGSETCVPGHSFGPAVHTYWLLHYVVYGFGTFVSDGVSQKVCPGEVFVISPYKETYYEADKSKPWRYIWIGFTTTENVQKVLNKSVICHPGLGEIFEDMLRCGKMENGRSAFLSGRLWEIFAILLEQKKNKMGYLKKALHYMNSEYMNGIKIQQVADRINLERSYFSSLFKAQMGISPQKYLINLRLEKAAELMTVYGESPTTASLSVGYTDFFLFSKIFKQHFGLSPKKYQQKVNGVHL